MLTREQLEIKLVRQGREAREQANKYRSRAVDLMTWKQFQAFQDGGEFIGKGKRVTKWLDLADYCMEESRAARAKLDLLLTLEVIQGERNQYFPSSPVGRLTLVS